MKQLLYLHVFHVHISSLYHAMEIELHCHVFTWAQLIMMYKMGFNIAVILFNFIFELRLITFSYQKSHSIWGTEQIGIWFIYGFTNRENPYTKIDLEYGSFMNTWYNSFLVKNNYVKNIILSKFIKSCFYNQIFTVYRNSFWHFLSCVTLYSLITVPSLIPTIYLDQPLCPDSQRQEAGLQDLTSLSWEPFYIIDGNLSSCLAWPQSSHHTHVTLQVYLPRPQLRFSMDIYMTGYTNCPPSIIGVYVEQGNVLYVCQAFVPVVSVSHTMCKFTCQCEDFCSSVLVWVKKYNGTVCEITPSQYIYHWHSLVCIYSGDTG